MGENNQKRKVWSLLSKTGGWAGVLVMTAMLFAFAVSHAAYADDYKGDDGTGSNAINVIQTITSNGRYSDIDPDAGGSPANITDLHSLKSYQKIVTFSSVQYPYNDRGTGTMTMPAGTYIAVSVNPQVSSLSSSYWPTVNPKAGDPTKGDIIVQYTESSLTKDDWNLPAADREQQTGLKYGTDWFYNTHTGTAYIKNEYAGKYITIYDYLAANQTTRNVTKTLYAYEILDNRAMSLVGDSVSYGGLTYKKQQSNNWQVPFYYTSKLGYATDILTVKGAAIKTENGVRTVTETWDLVEGTDYHVSSTGKITLEPTVCVSNILVYHEGQADSDKISVVVEERSSSSITLGILPSGYKYQMYQGGKLVKSQTSAEFTGLGSSTRYTFYIVDSNGKVVNKRSVSTTKSGTADGEPYVPPFSNGQSWTTSANVTGHYDVPDASEPSGINTTFFAHINEVGGEGDDIAALNSIIAKGNDFAFHCITPFAGYSDGLEVDLYITCTDNGADDGIAKFWAVGDASKYGTQSFSGPFTAPQDLPITIQIRKSGANPDTISTADNAAYSLAGAIFSVQDTSGNEVGQIETDESGFGELSGLRPGEYKVVEIQPPRGFAGADYDFTCSGGSGEIVENTVIDEEIYGLFDITKFDFQTDKSEPQGDGDLANVVYEVSYIGENTDDMDKALKWRSSEDADNRIETRTWFLKTLYDDDRDAYVAKFDSDHLADDSPSTEFYTRSGGEDGTVENVCPVGTYLVREIVHGTGYSITNDNGVDVAEGQPGEWHLYNFTVPEDEKGEVEKIDFEEPLYDMKEAAKKNGTGDNYTGITEFRDCVWHGELELRKGDAELLTSDTTDNVNSDIDRQGEGHLAGAAFAVYNRSQYNVVSPVDGKEKVPGEIVGVIVTDENGYASTTQWSKVSSWPAGRGSLAYGQYEVIEILPPKGYMLNNDWHGMAINASAQQYPTSSQFMHYTSSTNKWAGGSVAANAPAAYTDVWPNDGENKAYKPSSQAQWVNSNGCVVQFGTAGGTTLSTGDKSSWVVDQVIRGGVKIGKVDRENQQYKPQGAASLENHVLAIYSRNPHPVKIHAISDAAVNRTGSNNKNNTDHLVAAWNTSSTAPAVTSTTAAIGTQTKDGVLVAYINTKKITENGQVKYIAETDKDTLPYGIYRIKEVFVPASSGYLFDQVSADWYEDFAIGSNFSADSTLAVNASSVANFTKDATYRTVVTPSNATKASNKETESKQSGKSANYSVVDFTNDAKYCISNYVLRGDVIIHKTLSDVDTTVLKFTPFLVVSKTTGEAHILVTDQNGDASSMVNNQASQIQNDDTGEMPGFTLHTYKTNANDDDGVLTKTNGIPVLGKDSSSETGFQAISTIVKQSSDGLVKNSKNQTPDFQWAYGTWFNGRADAVTDYPRETWQNADWPSGGGNYITAGKGMAGINRLTPDDSLGALPFDDYIIFELRVPERTVTDIVTGQKVEAQSNEDYLMVNNGGFSITASNGEYVYKANAAQRTGYTVIGWSNPRIEDVRNTAYPQKVGLNNKPIPNIQTTLVDENGNHTGGANGEITLYDTVKYWNLEKGGDYVLKGATLHKVAYDANGNKVDGGIIATAPDKEFTAPDTDGSVIVEFTFDSSKLGGEATTAFEYLYDANGNFIKDHADITSDEQTFSFVEFGTKLEDEDGDKEVVAYKKIKLIDTVSYKGLIMGKEYTLNGTLHVKNDDGSDGGAAVDANGNTISASTTFTAKSASGTEEVVFEFEAPALAGKTTVAFEELIEDGKTFAVHADIDDNEQTVYFPDIKTTALDGITGDHVGLGENDVTLNDVVAYTNLVKGKTYTVNGTLMNRDDGKAITDADGDKITGTFTFTAGYITEADTVEDPTATVDELISALSKVEFKDVDADTLKTLSTELEKNFKAEKSDLTEKAALDAIDKSKSDLGDKVKDIDFSKITSAVKSYYASLPVKTIKGEQKEDPNATVTKFNDEIELVSGTVKIPFEMDDDDIRGKATVVFERLYQTPEKPDDVIPNGEHEVVISKTDAATSKELPGATLTVTDKSGKTVATWTSGTEPKKIKLDEGEYILTEVIAPGGYGTAESIDFTVDENGLVDGDKVEMKDAPGGGEPVAIHEDINDDNQMVYYPDIHTTAHVAGLKHVDFFENPEVYDAEGNITLTDVVTYENLQPGREYVLNGTLMNKENGLPVTTTYNGTEPVSSQVTFTPETPNGTVEVAFTFNVGRAGNIHDDSKLVVFENAYTPKTGVPTEFLHVAQHEDIDDVAQTVEFGELWKDITEENTPIAPTGDATPFIPLAVTAVLVAGGAVALGFRRKFSVK